VTLHNLKELLGGLGFTLVQEKSGIFLELDAPLDGTRVATMRQTMPSNPLWLAVSCELGDLALGFLSLILDIIWMMMLKWNWYDMIEP